MLASSYLTLLVVSLTCLLPGTFSAPLPLQHEAEILQPKAFVNQQAEVAYPALTFLTRFGTHIVPDEDILLEWIGGSGDYELYFIPQWLGQLEYYPIEIVQTKDKSHVWHTPKAEAYPEGTTFIIGINDASPSFGADWYDLTGLLKFGNS